jgi:hypothetical protein
MERIASLCATVASHPLPLHRVLESLRKPGFDHQERKAMLNRWIVLSETIGAL